MPDVLLTFEDLHAGNIVGDQYLADGVRISTTNPDTPPMVFDTNCPTGGDYDLTTGVNGTVNLGNVLIISEDGDQSDPDDNICGGTFVFEFEDPSDVANFRALDTEQGGQVRLYDVDGTLINTVYIDCLPNNGQATIDVFTGNVARMEVELYGPGAIDGLCYYKPDNQDPDAVNDNAVIDEGSTIVLDVLANDSDPDGDALTIIETVSSDGEVTINDDGTLTFTPNPGFTGEARVGYEISDGKGGTDVAWVHITVNPVNDAPDAQDDAVIIDEDTTVVLDVLANDSDPDGDTLTVIAADSPNGTVTINDDGTLTFTPDANFNGITSLEYTITDGNGGQDTATVMIEVCPVNDDPDAVDDVASTAFNTPVVIDVLANDSDVDGDPLTIIEAVSSDGVVTINDDGTLSFTPNPGFVGDAMLDYVVSDGNGGTDVAWVTVSVSEAVDGNQPPVANDDVATTDENTGVVIDVLANDSDPNGDPLTITEATSSDGVVVINDNGTLTFTPNEGFTGDAMIDYIVSDGNGGEDEAWVQVTVNPVNYDPVANNDTHLLDDPTNSVVIDVLANDTDADGDDLTVTSAETSEGTVVINDDNTITFTPEPGFDGFTRIDYEISDGNGGTDSAQVVVTVRDGVVTGTDGDDVIDVDYTGDPDGDLVDAGDAILPGMEGDDDGIVGGDGNDTITAGEGSDAVFGGEGDDVILTGGSDPSPDLGFPGFFEPDADPNNDIDFVDGGDGDDVISTGDDADTIIGSAGDDVIDGGFDADTIDGGSGNDVIVGGEGSDQISGGDGNDVIFGGISTDLGAEDIFDIPDVDGDPVTNNGQDVISGGAGNDIIFGGDDDDTINGDTGDDFIDGGVDDDTISGGPGNDILIGGQGEDTISGGADADTIIVNGDEGFGDVVDGGVGGDDNDVLDLQDAGRFRIVNETVDPDGNSTSGTVEFLDEDSDEVLGTLDFSEIESIVPCFTPGTAIATPRGERLVEELQIGDKVITRDNGIQEIRWIGAKRMDGRELQENPHLQPVLVQKGSLGNGLPERDMLVSPNHRMMVNNDRVSLYFEENEVLVSAKHLVNPTEGVQPVSSMGTTYIHFMFDAHEIVLSNGAWTESFQPGDYSLKGVGNAQRQEIFELFPELRGQAGREAYASARLTLKKHEARMLFR